MDIVTSNYLPGDPRLIDQIVYELKSQGIFDQFRKECIADVDTKPAYQNLSQRVEGSVISFLKKQKFSEDTNKNQLREQLRKNISESGFLETGVERIVDQVVNPKINTVFLPKVEDVVYRYLGIIKPNQQTKQEFKVEVEDLLPNDLEAISPESVHDHSFNSNSEKKDESIETNENSLNSSNTKTEDESPPFELLEENTKFSLHEENSVDSHLSGISGLVSHESHIKDENQMDVTQDISQNSLNSEGNLSIVTSEEDTKMEICEDSNLFENTDIKDNSSHDNEIMETKIIDKKETNADGIDTEEKTENEEKIEEIKTVNEIKMDDKKDGKKFEDKKTSEDRNDSKKSHDKHKSSRSDKDRKDDKDKKRRSKSQSKSKDRKDSKSHSKHSSSSKEMDKKVYKNEKGKEEGSEKDKPVKKDDKDRDKSKDKSSKNKEKSERERDRNEKNKDKVVKDKERSEKEKVNKDKSDKDRSEKEKSVKEKNKSEKEKNKSDRNNDKVDKDKSNKDKSEKEKGSSSKHSREKSSSSSKKDGSNKEKDKNEDKSSKDKTSSNKDKISSSSSQHKESFNKDKHSSKTSKDKEHLKSSTSSSKDKEKKGGGDSKSRSSDKHKKDKNKTSHHDKSSSIKKEKDKKPIDDHYSLKDKKTERRSTDRDSNDGSSKMSRNGSFTESYSQSFKGSSSKESSEVFSSGSGDSSNSDQMENKPIEMVTEADNTDAIKEEAPQTIKYAKPKFASNIHEAMKIMKIRKQLAKMERQNQLSLAHVDMVKDSQSEVKVEQSLKRLSVVLEKSLLKPNPAVDSLSIVDKTKLPLESKPDKEQYVLPDEQIKNKEPPTIIAKNETLKGKTPDSNEPITEETTTLKSQDLSMESFEALEARLAQEMSNVNYHMYGDEDDNYEYASVSFSPVKKRAVSSETRPGFKKINFDTSDMNVDEFNEIELVVNKQIKESTEEIDVIKYDMHIPIIHTNVEHQDVISDQIEVPSKETDVFGYEDSNIIIENEEELVIDQVHEECVDYFEEAIINDAIDHDGNVVVFDSNNEVPEETVDSFNETIKQDDFEKCEVELGSVQLDSGHHNNFEEKDVEIKLNIDNDEFRGFTDVDKNNANVIKFTEKISELEHILDNLKSAHKSHISRNSISVLNKIGKDKMNYLIEENQILLKHGLTLEATLKEVTNISSTIQDLLQKNGKKLFIKIDKLEYDLPSKILVSLQGMETNEIVNNPTWEVNNVKIEEEVQQKIQIEVTEDRNAEAKVEESKVCNKEEAKQNGQLFNESSNGGVFSPKLNNNGLREQNNCIRDTSKWENDDEPCYYFDKSDCIGEKHLKILNDMIARLEKAVEKQSLQIQNNIPSSKKRGRKRKAQSTENNNSMSAQYKSEPKRKHLSDATSNQNGGNLCNTSLTLILDGPQNQSFSLPLSPADSEKSYEHKKEEPVTVKTKRTGRVSNNKRYSSEDLYKPRPVLSCSTTRRRSIKPEKPKP